MLAKRRTEVLLVSQTVIITLLLYWMYLESRSNGFFRAWLSQNFPFGLILLNEWIVAGAITELFLVTGFWIMRLESGRISQTGKIKRSVKKRTEPGLEIEGERPGPFSKPKPLYDTIDIRTLVVILLLSTQAISLWFITASIFRITSFTANSFYYYSHLPITYWWGLAATLALFFIRSALRGSRC